MKNIWAEEVFLAWEKEAAREPIMSSKYIGLEEERENEAYNNSTAHIHIWLRELKKELKIMLNEFLYVKPRAANGPED